MNTIRRILPFGVGLVVTIILGTTLQMVFWQTPERAFWDALIHFPLAWIVYVLVGLVIAERAFRLF
jgi:hypothetical protein